MHITSRKPLREFSEKHPPAKTPLDSWFAEVNRAKWSSFADIRAAYGSADVVQAIG
jgi:mRNA interferase HigB